MPFVRGPWLPLIALAVVLFGVVAGDDTEVARRALARALSTATDDVATLAGLRDPAGAAEGGPGGPSAPGADPAAAGGLPVEVVVEGDEPWLAEQARAVTVADPAFDVGQSPHQLRFEYVHDERTWIVRGQLWRRGWSLQPPKPVVARVVPWIAVLAAALGAVLWMRRVPLAIASAIAAAAAQWGLHAVSWPESLVQPTWTESVAAGPAATAVVNWARALPDSSFAIGAGVVTLCTVLIGFDHRRSRGRGGVAMLSGVVGLMSLLAWAEAAWRAEFFAWASTGVGALGTLGLIGLWGHRAWSVLQPPRDARRDNHGEAAHASGPHAASDLDSEADAPDNDAPDNDAESAGVASGDVSATDAADRDANGGADDRPSLAGDGGLVEDSDRQ